MFIAPEGPPRSHLFTVRLWQEDLGGDQLAWRGKVQHVMRGEAYYFQGLENLGELIRLILDNNPVPEEGEGE